MQLANIGFGNIISANRIVAILRPDSAPIKRMIQDSKKNKLSLDATYGKKTKSVIIMDSGHVILSALDPKNINDRFFNASESDANVNFED